MQGRRLLVIINNFYPDRGGGAAVFTDMCEALVRRGYAVTVRCAYPYYPEWVDKSGRNGWRVEFAEHRGMRIERHGLFIPRQPRVLWQRLLYEGTFFLSLLRSLFRGHFDAVMVYCPLMGSVAFAGLLRRLRGLPVWLNVQDLPADAATASGISSGGVSKWLERIQNWLFHRSDIWSSISPVMIERLCELRRGPQPVLYIPNWLNASLGQEIDACGGKLERPPRERVRLLYAGNIGAKQGLLEFIQQLAGTDLPLEVRIHGSGAEAATISQWLSERADPRFTFGPFLDEADFAAALHWTDFFLITEKAESGASFIPSKLIPGLASGSAILAICSAGSPLGQEMEEARPGPRFDWSDMGAIVEMLGAVHRDPSRLHQWQRNAVERATRYRREHVVTHIDTVLQTLMDRSTPVAERAARIRTTITESP